MTRRHRRLIAMRQDLVRVARLQGAPDGFAPSVLYYREHGRFVEKTIQGVVGGYEEDGNPILNWQRTCAKLGLRMYAEHYHADPERVTRDVYRVANLLRRPHRIPPLVKYRELGNWDPHTVYRHLGVRTWGEVADRLKLARNKAFPTRAEAGA